MSREGLLESKAEISRLKAEISVQLEILADKGYGARVARVQAHVDSLVSSIDRIESGRADLLEALLRGEKARQELTVTNTRALFPALNTSFDNQLYYMLTGESDSRPSPASGGEALNREELLRFWHLSRLFGDSVVGHTTLVIASSLQNPTFVARTQEAFDSIAQRMGRSLAYLAENGGPELDQRVLPLANRLREAGSGQESQFGDLEARLRLAVAERDLIAVSETSQAALLGELDALAGEVQQAASSQKDDPSGRASAGRISLLVIGIVGVAGILLAAGYFGLRRRQT